jgi:hypothetical protein
MIAPSLLREWEVRGKRVGRRKEIMAFLAAIQQFLMIIWFFLTDKPAAEALTAEQPPDTQTLRLRRRWERSKERVRRQRLTP